MGLLLKRCDGSYHSVLVNLPCPDGYHYAGIHTGKCGCQLLVCTNKTRCENRDICSIGHMNLEKIKDYCYKKESI